MVAQVYETIFIPRSVAFYQVEDDAVRVVQTKNDREVDVITVGNYDIESGIITIYNSDEDDNCVDVVDGAGNVFYVNRYTVRADILELLGSSNTDRIIDALTENRWLDKGFCREVIKTLELTIEDGRIVGKKL